MNLKNCQKPLNSNPFQVYRDPKTGRWVVIQSGQQSIKKKAQLA